MARTSATLSPAIATTRLAVAESPKPLNALRSAQFLQQLETEIRIRSEEIGALIKARDVLVGSPMGPVISSSNGNGLAGHDKTPTTVADAVEQLLSRHEALHIDDLRAKLVSEFNMRTTQKNLVNTLNRWVSRGKRFERPRPNTFALANGLGKRRAG